jgi:TolB protein
MKRIYLNSLLFVIVIAYSTLARAQDNKKTQMISTIAFASTRHDSTGHLSLDASQIYLMNEDGTHIRRITENKFADNFPALSPDGKKIVFESNRLRADGEPLNTSDLFIMNTDGTGQTLLIRGSSATWSPDSKQIAYHASASGTGLPIRPHPGAATRDNDIFVLNVNDVLNKSAKPKNITNSPMAIDDDPDWCPVGR